MKKQALVKGRGREQGAKHMGSRQSNKGAQEVSDQASWEWPLWGNADLTSAFLSWSSQHNPVSEHLHYLNFILWWCLLIGQTWLTASELQSDSQERAEPQHRNHHRGDGTSCWIYETQAHRCLLKGPGLTVGWEGLRWAWEEAKEKGRWKKPSHPNDHSLGLLRMYLHPDHVS